ncbi:hypothetical protein X471_01142 [Bartonella bacilliformis str. Heidi Mejia]|nr:hypothetical protein [Bartonella bacilliformis]EYS91007.1 hypothetical protein X471_01142 [Bartonella bacilliformis str. Heidi Mejia]KEG17879.1 hypothetical protein H707_01048 [Bartonella bacilliformis Hosp800-02]KEG21800.1 hypothetical protein H708_01053 [Bartonella bacilliformis VAB9028]KEG22404.1 hypothetical protein H706_01254 [Bartonella bacilliformis CAR600-02]KEG23175.1 hypothetical protein H706_01063 [Bartonella bacilliformis CAR600-02]
MIVMTWLKEYFLITLASLAAFFMALAKVFDLGKKAEQHQQTERALEMAVRRLEVENEINRKSNADVRSALFQWVRNK